MKTKEFKRRLSMFAGTHGMRVNSYDDSNYVVLETDDSNKLEVLCVDTTQYFSVHSMEIAFEELPHLSKQEVMNDIIFPYISTPLEKREEEKKYVYKLPIIYRKHITGFIIPLYLRKDDHDGLAIRLNSQLVQAQENTANHFTDKEVEQYTGKDRALFNACEKIEVTE